MAETELIILIIITSLNFLSSLFSPLIIAFVEFSKRIGKSQCCGSSLELNEAKALNEEMTKKLSEHVIQINELTQKYEQQ